MNEITGSDYQSEWVLAQPVGIPDFKPKETYYTATQMGISSAVILVRSTVQYTGSAG
jgi:hypothetical protein